MPAAAEFPNRPYRVTLTASVDGDPDPFALALQAVCDAFDEVIAVVTWPTRDEL